MAQVRERVEAESMSRRFTTRWVSLREADRFIAKHHRHHSPSQGGIVALGLWEGTKLVGVSVLGRPVSRMLQEQGIVECVRSCVLPDLEGVGDHANCAASVLAARLRRVAQSLGFARMVTYTLPTESGSSLDGAGWQDDLSLAGGGEWDSPGRSRDAANYPTVRKRRWWTSLRAQKEIEL
jgi:hypothetical protein